MANSVFDDIIIDGDWNFDPGRNTRFCKIVREFFDRNDFQSIWTKFPAEFIYQHTDLKSFSFVRCVDAAPIHLVDNRSNHSPIMLKIDIPVVVKKENSGGILISRPNLNKADNKKIEAYACELDQKMSELSLQVV